MSRQSIYITLSVIFTLLLIILTVLHRLPYATPLFYVAGIDSPDKHWEISQQPLTQVLYLPQAIINSIGIKLVPYGGEPVGNITLKIFDHTKQQIYQTTIPSSIIQDDEFTYFGNLNLKHISSDTITIELKADHPDPTYIAARVDSTPEGQEGSYLHREGALLQGFLALDIYQQESLLHHLITSILNL